MMFIGYEKADSFHFTPQIRGEEKLPLNSTQLKYLKELVRTASWIKQFECDVFFLYVTGVESVVPGMELGGSGDNDRFPQTNDWYTKTDNSRIHFIGWLMHGQDFRSGSGGFFSGYR